MNIEIISPFRFLACLLIVALSTGTKAYSQKPVKVFILAGQSNMQGHGETVKGKKGNLSWLVQNDKAGKYQHLVDKKGNWKKRDDVFIYANDKYDNIKTGELSVGYGAYDYTIGPELQFGNIIGDFYDENVLLIKTTWGGKSLAVDFCPPSAASDTGYARIPYAPQDTGYYYVQMLATIYDVLHNLHKYVPNYSGEGYQITGFAWHQGWNDRVNKAHNAAYESNLAHLIKDVRRDLAEPNLPFVLATTGMRSYKDNDPREISLIQAQMAIPSHAEFEGNVKVTDTRNFWRSIEDSPAKQNYHWNRNAETYCLIGESLAESMLALLYENKTSSKIRSAKCGSDEILAPTPPMGWNSWNAFEKNIDENKIKTIADIMVSSGMRDAGYEYLVLDDAWMAAERNEKGELVADSLKFPGGMKAIGDYIHSKGLKYGIYECRGNLTCQNLPGSFEHEQTDMNSFASWGVDYIKMDACFAARNGRLSSEDFAIYADAIKNTGRPMVFSISDFGQGAWAWGGKNYAQLWRTSMDIYPFIKSVYRCAETSGGAGSSHPAFNGLWQFAGPNHWNDPDMLQIGNLKNADEDKVHFSLWAVLAAPLMAGNDLRVMSDSVKNILLAPEVIAINQDPRAQQGYKVFQKDSIEIYNKPLSDGTTAVLLLNKGKRKTDVTVTWKQIGLDGHQPVRDLWAQKDLGNFQDSITARNLGQHGHLLIKVGRIGAKLLPGPTPVSPEKYTVTKKGTTYLSDLYYIMKEFNHPVADKNFKGEPIQIEGKTYNKGLGCKSKSIQMYKLDGRANRFKAIVGLDKCSPDEKMGKFRILNEDKFGGRVLFDSGQMEKGNSQEVDIDVSGLNFILLEFVGKGVFGNWADAKVIVNN
ncbi:sialate O-acetylesterase [Saccharicrinis sp. 156]|uniref:sialate O-acetylesterase n=1 Tax=Saccharicrinis sp. 156 TaxID=3417574 RepID=UPI003D325DA7